MIENCVLLWVVFSLIDLATSKLCELTLAVTYQEVLQPLQGEKPILKGQLLKSTKDTVINKCCKRK
jgi:hypothetical protein